MIILNVYRDVIYIVIESGIKNDFQTDDYGADVAFMFIVRQNDKYEELEFCRYEASDIKMLCRWDWVWQILQIFQQLICIPATCDLLELVR